MKTVDETLTEKRLLISRLIQQREAVKAAAAKQARALTEAIAEQRREQKQLYEWKHRGLGTSSKAVKERLVDRVSALQRKVRDVRFSAAEAMKAAGMKRADIAKALGFSMHSLGMLLAAARREKEDVQTVAVEDEEAEA